MKEHIFDVFVYLLENHFDNPNLVLNETTLAAHLQQAGFNPELIKRAFHWLAQLTQVAKNLPEISEESTAMRILDPEEREKIDKESWGFLLHLEQLGILDPFSREVILDRLMNLEIENINLHQVKCITLMVLYSQQDHLLALQTLEEIILNESDTVNLQ